MRKLMVLLAGLLLAVSVNVPIAAAWGSNSYVRLYEDIDGGGDTVKLIGSDNGKFNLHNITTGLHNGCRDGDAFPQPNWGDCVSSVLIHMTGIDCARVGTDWPGPGKILGKAGDGNGDEIYIIHWDDLYNDTASMVGKGYWSFTYSKCIWY